MLFQMASSAVTSISKGQKQIEENHGQEVRLG